jgi:hypothetical protein
LSDGVADERVVALDVLQSSLDALGIVLFEGHLRSAPIPPQAIFRAEIIGRKCNKPLILLATPAGFEPATFSLEGCCSIP